MTLLSEIKISNALIFAPIGRDAKVAELLLTEAKIGSVICTDLAAFQETLGDEICFAVVTEEALRSANLKQVSQWISAQETWSDLPFIVLTERAGGPERNPGAARLSSVLGNVTFMERPFHPTTFLSVARTALKGRQRQYDARARMEELKEGEERLRTALIAGHLGSWELDINTWELTASETCKALFGHSLEQSFSYEDLISSVHPDDRARVQEAIRLSIATQSDFAIEYRNVWPDGSLHWAEMHARLVRDRRKARFIGVSSDITDRKVAEERLLQLNEMLEVRVHERTAELKQAHNVLVTQIQQRERAEAQLRQAQKMEMIGQLTGGVAHDFNNLLMAVLGNLGLLRKRIPDDPRTNRLIDGAEQGARRGAALTQRLLAFARRQDLQIESRSLVDLVRGMTDLLERSVGSTIDVQMDLPNGLPLALVDANQVELALLNLVVNARDAMPDGGVVSIAVDCIEMEPGQEIPAGRYLRLIVSDTGHGMDAETLRKAAEPFFSTKELGKGTGLGLSMIHGLALQLNGALRLSSEVGQGTVAQLWLPVSDAVVEHKSTSDTVFSQKNATPPATILIVDDDPLIAMSTVDMLEDLGHRVLEANSGADALEILRRSEQIDLLITDYSMPKMTGVQLAEAARALHPNLPVLLATGYAELPTHLNIHLPRLAKPYQQDDMALEISKLLRSTSTAPAH